MAYPSGCEGSRSGELPRVACSGLLKGCLLRLGSVYGDRGIGPRALLSSASALRPAAFAGCHGPRGRGRTYAVLACGRDLWPTDRLSHADVASTLKDALHRHRHRHRHWHRHRVLVRSVIRNPNTPVSRTVFGQLVFRFIGERLAVGSHVHLTGLIPNASRAAWSGCCPSHVADPGLGRSSLVKPRELRQPRDPRLGTVCWPIVLFIHFISSTQRYRTQGSASPSNAKPPGPDATVKISNYQVPVPDTRPF